MAKLPPKFEDKSQLKNMKVGESGYTVPWAMWVDLDGNCWLNENYTIQGTPGGTVQLKITRVTEGYIAHINDMKDNERWQKVEDPCFMSPNEVIWGKVVGFELSPTQVVNVVASKTKSIWNSFFKTSNN